MPMRRRLRDVPCEAVTESIGLSSKPYEASGLRHACLRKWATEWKRLPLEDVAAGGSCKNGRRC